MTTAYASRAIRVREVERAIADAWSREGMTGAAFVEEWTEDAEVQLELDRLASVAAEAIVDKEYA